MVRSEGGEDASIFNAFRLAPKTRGALPWPTVLFNPELYFWTSNQRVARKPTRDNRRSKTPTIGMWPLFGPLDPINIPFPFPLKRRRFGSKS